jgi:predicted dehydrogenase
MKASNHPVNRRTFVKAAAIVPFAAVRGTAANSAVSIGLIGSGNRGPNVCRLLVQNTPGRITALSDLYDEKIERAKKTIGVEDPAVYKDYEKLLASDVDAVMISTPAFLHAEHFEKAVQAGKHIYIEKPAAPDVAGCKRIMRAADSADRKLNITFGFQRRYGQTYHKAKALLDSGAIGTIRLAMIQFLKSQGTRKRPGAVDAPTKMDDKIAQWYSWRHLSGDLIVENNIHLIDVMNWFVGERPTKALGTGGQTVPRLGDVRDHGTVTYDYSNNVQGTLIGTTLGPPTYRVVNERFFGERGGIETASAYWKHFRNRDDVMTEKAPRNETIDAVDAFVKRIAEGRPENTGVRGAESTLTAILGRMAMDQKREVTWDEMWNSES